MDVTSITTLAYTVGVGHVVGGNVGTSASGFDTTGQSAGNYILNGSAGGSTNANGVIPGAGGTATGGDFNITGSSGGGGTSGNSGGGSAGGPFGGLGHGAAASADGVTALGTPGYIYVEEYSDASLLSGGLGKVRQMKSNLIGTTDSSNNNFPADNTIPQITEGKEFCNLAFTPTSATSKLLITVQVTYWLSIFARIYVAAFQSGVNDALATSYDTGDAQTPGEPNTFSFSFVVDSGSTTARTYSMRFGGSGSYTANINYGTRFGGTIKSGLIIQEIEV